MSFPLGLQLSLKIVFSFSSHQWEALIAFRFIMSGAPAWTHNLFRQIPSADLQLFQEADGMLKSGKY